MKAPKFLCNFILFTGLALSFQTTSLAQPATFNIANGDVTALINVINTATITATTQPTGTTVTATTSASVIIVRPIYLPLIYINN